MITNPHLIAELIMIHQLGVLPTNECTLPPGLHFGVSSMDPGQFAEMRMNLAQIVRSYLLRDHADDESLLPDGPAFEPIPAERVTELVKTGINVLTLKDGALVLIGSRFVDAEGKVRDMGDQHAHDGFLEPLKRYIDNRFGL